MSMWYSMWLMLSQLSFGRICYTRKGRAGFLLSIVLTGNWKLSWNGKVLILTRIKRLHWVALMWPICLICKTLLFEFYWGFTKEYTFKNRRLTEIEPILEDGMEGKNSWQVGWHVCVLGLDCHSPTSELSPFSRTFASYTWAVTGKAIQAEK